MSCFVIPVSICKEICQLISKFWWRKGGDKEKGMHWLSWDKLAMPKLEGGASWLWSSWASYLPDLQKHIKITIRNGKSTRLNDPNWVPGLNRGSPELKVGWWYVLGWKSY
ncbi:RNA-directed DNA polymerase [Striga asiatica]|uniref:RNA-directed DNA polymerase n=1 Tax=Striga asiatica TaxID=4170 RepID=A0A5A7NXE6_STRAF|nr:RNA-directed DNA polymerase [Striga asiatica]